MLVIDASGNGHDGQLEAGYALFLPGPENGEVFKSTPRGNRCIHFAGGRIVADRIGPDG